MSKTNGATSPFADVSLIGPGEPPPYRVVNEAAQGQALLVCDHASNLIPHALAELGLDYRSRQKHIAWDMGAERATQYLARHLNLTAVLAGYSRLVMDLNRKPDLPAAFPEESDHILVPGNQGLSYEEKALRKKTFFDTYHGAIERELDKVRARGQVPALVSIHSFTQALFMEAERPWQYGVLYDKDDRIAVGLKAFFGRHPEVRFGDNVPYSGEHPDDFTVDHHGEGAGIPCIGIEIRQDLLATQISFQHWVGLLCEALREVLADPSLYQLRPGFNAPARPRFDRFLEPLPETS